MFLVVFSPGGWGGSGLFLFKWVFSWMVGGLESSLLAVFSLLLLCVLSGSSQGCFLSCVFGADVNDGVWLINDHTVGKMKKLHRFAINYLKHVDC